jgi:hypothetical protein
LWFDQFGDHSKVIHVWIDGMREEDITHLTVTLPLYQTISIKITNTHRIL